MSAPILLAHLLGSLLGSTEPGTLRTWGDMHTLPGRVRSAALGGGPIDLTHGIAALEDGTVHAWGPAGNPALHIPEGLQGVVATAAGGECGLALLSDHSVKAWGRGSIVDSLPEGLKARKILAFGDIAMALRLDGTVVLWGFGNPRWKRVPESLQGHALDITLSPSGPLATTIDGTIHRWGSTFGASDTSIPGLARSAAQAPDSLWALQLDGTVVTSSGSSTWGAPWRSGIRDVSAMGYSLLLLDSSGRAEFRVGGNSSFGLTKLPDGLAPPFRSATFWHLMVSLIDTAGNLLIAGNGSAGYPPVGPENIVPLPGAKWTRLWSQPDVLHLGETADGRVLAWGFGSDSDFALPPNLRGWQAISASRLADGTWGFAAVRSDSTVATWGGAPSPPPAIGPVVHLVAWGNGGFVALRPDGSLAGWGDTLPTPSWTGIRTLQSTGFTLLAIDSSGRMLSWGAQADSLSGLLTGISSPRATLLSVGGRFCLATATDSLRCHDLAAASVSLARLRVRLHRTDDIVQFTSTWNEVFVLHADGSLEGWDRFGVPIALESLQGSSMIAAGSHSLMAIVGDKPTAARRSVRRGLPMKAFPTHVDLHLERPEEASVLSLEGRVVEHRRPALEHRGLGRGLPRGIWLVRAGQRSALWSRP